MYLVKITYDIVEHLPKQEMLTAPHKRHTHHPDTDQAWTEHRRRGVCSTGVGSLRQTSASSSTSHLKDI